MMMPIKTRSRWERLKRKEEDGDAQAGEKGKKVFGSCKKEKEEEERKEKGKERKEKKMN